MKPPTPRKHKSPPRLPDGAVFELHHSDAATLQTILYARYDALKTQWAVSVTSATHSHSRTGKTLFPTVASIFNARGEKPMGWQGTLTVDRQSVGAGTDGSPFALLSTLDTLYRQALKQEKPT